MTFIFSYIIFTASSPTSAAQINLASMRNNSLTNQDVSFDPCGDNRLRNSCMSLDEKTRTMSRSGSFRDGFEEGKRRQEKDGWMTNVLNVQSLCVSPGHVFFRCLVKSVIRCNPFPRPACLHLSMTLKPPVPYSASSCQKNYYSICLENLYTDYNRSSKKSPQSP